MLDKAQIIEDRKSGMTMQQVAEKHGISKQYVSQIVGKCRMSGHKAVTESQCVYPNLRKWMNEHNVSKSELLCRMYLSPVAVNINKIGRIMDGEMMPKKDWIDAMIAATGMTYERLFSEKAWGGKNGK